MPHQDPAYPASGPTAADSPLRGDTPLPAASARRKLGKGTQVPARGRRTPLAWWWAALLALAPMAACDGIAEHKLVAGQHTEADVRRWMGQPEMIWEEEDGTRVLEYPRGPAGTQTYLVTIAPDGRYREMKRALTDENFARVKPGMDRDQVRQILGKPTTVERFSRLKEEVWSWLHEAHDTRKMYFNAHFDQDTGLLKKVSRVQDWRDGNR